MTSHRDRRSADGERAIGPSGICRADLHEWRHTPPGSQRRVCRYCGMIAQASPCRCAECDPRNGETGDALPG